jgi:predicted Fe-Mo cluster-binding NifX family protein
MIAIPLDKEESTVISKLYGNSPYFAFLNEETGTFKVVENVGCGDGIDTASFISSQNIDSTIFYYMGEKVYNYLDEKGLKVYSSSKTHLTLDEIYNNFRDSKYELVTKENSSVLLDSGSSSCTCSPK